MALVNEAQADGWKVLVTNGTYERFPHADVLLVSDNKFWLKHGAKIAAHFHGERWSPDSRATKRHQARHIRIMYEVDRRSGLKAGLARHGKWIRHNGNTGANAVSLAYCFGMKVGILVAYDMQLTGGVVNADGDLEGGPIHHHGPHTHTGNPTAESFRSWRARFDVLARDLKEVGTHMVNATIETALTSVERSPLEVAVTLKL